MAENPPEDPPLFFPHLQPVLPPLPEVPSESQKKKFKIEWVNNDSRRRASLKKRREGILKKAEELSVLCGVNVNAIIYSPGDESPVVYPKEVHETEAMCTRFAQLPEMERNNLMRTHQQFLEESIEKMKKKVWNKHEEIQQTETMLLVHRALAGDDISGIDLENLKKMKAAMEKMYTDLFLKSSFAAQASASSPAPAAATNPAEDSSAVAGPSNPPAVGDTISPP